MLESGSGTTFCKAPSTEVLPALPLGLEIPKLDLLLATYMCICIYTESHG